MGETVGHDPALTPLLQAVVTDGLGGVEGLFQIAVLQHLLLLHMVTPDPGETVGLQFEFDRQLVLRGLAQPLLLLAHLGRDAEQVLHVVAHLVGDHIALGEVAIGPELVTHVLIEGEIDIDCAVCRAVEGTHDRLALTAAGLGGSAIEHQPGGLILVAASGEDLAPGVFGGGEHHRGESGQGIAGRLRHILARRLALLGRLVEQWAQVHAVVTRHHDHDNQDEAALAAEGQAAAPAATALLAPVFHVAALTAILPAHSPILPSLVVAVMIMSAGAARLMRGVIRPRASRAGSRGTRRSGSG